jgi:hypothetical protein
MADQVVGRGSEALSGAYDPSTPCFYQSVEEALAEVPPEERRADPGKAVRSA